MDYKSVAIQAIYEAGKVLVESFYSNTEAKEKGAHDLVSKTDINSEKTILEIIKSSFPKHTYIAEESGKSKTDSEYTWYIDPLDGTSNFLLGIPYFSISIALSLKDEVIFGAVFNPLLDELYTAEKGNGSYLNDKEIKVSSRSNIKSAFIASAYSANEKDIKRGLKTIEQLSLATRKVVINFSPALDLCNVARGKLDALVDNGTTPEDHAAGSLIVTEAGGQVSNYKKDTWNVNEVGIVASNGTIQKSVASLAL